MGDFGIGAGELLLIMLVALIVFGPGKIFEVARGLGKTLNAFKKTSRDLSNAFSRELEIQERQQAHEKAAPKSEVACSTDCEEKARELSAKR